MLSTIILPRSDPVLLDAEDFGSESLEGRLPLTFLEASGEVHRILGLSDDIVTDRGISAKERSIRLLHDVAETLVEDARDDLVHVVFQRPHDRSTYLGRGDIALESDADRILRSFLIDGDTDDRLLVVLDLYIYSLSRIYWSGDVSEDLLELSLRTIDIDVPYDDDPLEVGAVPLLVVVAEHLIGEATDDVHLPDGHTLAVLVVRVSNSEETLEVTCVTAITGTPFLLDDATLIVDLLILKANEATPVV